MRTRFKLIVSFLVLTLILADAYAIMRLTWQAPVSVRIGELTSRSADISLHCNPSMIVYGETTSISGQLHNATSNVGIPYETLSLYYRSSVETSWIYITSVSTESDGSFSYYWWSSSSLAVGSYVANASFSGNSEFDQWSSRTDLRVVRAPAPPTLVSPGSSSSPGEEIFTLTPTFTWNSVPGADEYGLYIRDMDSNTLIFDSQARGKIITGTSYTLLPEVLRWGRHYRWNMNSHNEGGWGEYCTPLYYYTALAPPKFGIGSWVRTTTNLNVRDGPGLSYTVTDTVPLGTIGQILGGPVGANGFVWWDVNYTGGVRGWSVDNWLELHAIGAPTCVVELQQDGIEITEVDVWEFFDIYVGDSTSDTSITQVRFSSDHVQDGYPTGRWTDWFDWGVSSEDWYATTKIKHWAFDTPGYKEVWAEVRDEVDHTAVDLSKIFVPAPALPIVMSPLTISPMKDMYSKGDSITAEFTLENVGEVQITLDNLTLGGRLNGQSQVNGYPDFPHQQVTLLPHIPFEYTGALTLTKIGNYQFFIAYYIEDPSPEEKKLLDQNNWNTRVQLREGLTQTDRVKNIIVYEEYVAPENVRKLQDDITQAMQMQVTYPRHVLDEWNFGEALGVLWNDLTSWRSNENQNRLYEQFYQEGINYDNMRYRTLYNSRKLLNMGDFTNAKRLWRHSYDLATMSYDSFSAAAQVFGNSLEPAMRLANKVMDKAMQLFEIGMKIACPEAAVAVSWFFTGVRYAVNVKVWGMDPSDALDKAMIERIVKFLFSEAVCPNLGGRTLENYIGNRVGAFLGFDAHLMQELFGDPKLEFLVYKTIKEYAVSMGEDYVIRFTQKAEEVAVEVIDQLRKATNSIEAEDKSPVEIRVYDLRSAMTGLENGTVNQDISRSVYYNETVWILCPSDCYYYGLIGREDGTYGLTIRFTENGNSTIFNAVDIPISTIAQHVYVIGWNFLSIGEEGVTVLVNADGDDMVDRIFSSDSELRSDEFTEKTSPTCPTHTLTISAGENGTTFPPQGTYACSANSSVQIIAIPGEGFALDYWQLDGVNVGSSNPHAVMMQENHTLSAIFRLGIYDVAITSVLPSKTIVGEGYNLNAHVTIANLGDYTAIFNITFYADTAASETIGIILEGGTSITIVFPWNTTGLALGNYSLWAYAEPISGETSIGDNTFVFGWVLVTIPGDVNGDRSVDATDLIELNKAYGSTYGSPNWNANCDVNGDNKADALDLFIHGKNYGQSFP